MKQAPYEWLTNGGKLTGQRSFFLVLYNALKKASSSLLLSGFTTISLPAGIKATVNVTHPRSADIFSIFEVVKKTYAIFFLAIYLLSATQLSELLKIPLLVEHYLEHKNENKELTLLAFLEIHYAHGNPKDSDYEKDMKLPFKTIVNLNIAAASPVAPFTTFRHQLLTYFKEPRQQFTDYKFTYSSAFLSAIWQPPKCA